MQALRFALSPINKIIIWKQGVEDGSMSNILENIDRLSAALDDLDTVVAARGKGESLLDVANQRDSLSAELDQLKQENADLRKALKIAQKRNDNLAFSAKLSFL